MTHPVWAEEARIKACETEKRRKSTRDAMMAREHVPWEDCLPMELVDAQRSWQRSQKMVRMQAAGFYLKEIADSFAISNERARQLIKKASRGRKSPLNIWLDDTREVCEMSNAIQSGRLFASCAQS